MSNHSYRRTLWKVVYFQSGRGSRGTVGQQSQEKGRKTDVNQGQARKILQPQEKNATHKGKQKLHLSFMVSNRINMGYMQELVHLPQNCPEKEILGNLVIA